MNRPVDTSFHELSESLPATIGIAVAAVGAKPVSLGAWSSGVAWSTIKVPLAIAALRAGSDNTELVFKTITQSDNPPPRSCGPNWVIPPRRRSVSKPSSARRATQPPWSNHGDSALNTRHSVKRNGPWPTKHSSPPGYRSIPDASRVVDLMHDLSTDHRWGLAAKGFAAKGGWGPGRAGDYLVRQFAIVPTGSGTVGVALAADTYDGGYAAGVDVAQHAGRLACRPPS